MKSFEELKKIIEKYDKNKEYDKIVELIDDLTIQYNANDYRVYLVKAISYYNLNNFKKAINLAEQAINLLERDVTNRLEKRSIIDKCKEYLSDFRKGEYNEAYGYLETKEYAKAYENFSLCFDLSKKELEVVPLYYSIIKYTIVSIHQMKIKEKSEIIDLVMCVLYLIIKVHNIIKYKSEDVSAVHYTNLSVAQFILQYDSKENKGEHTGKFQFCYAPLMNDPEEGDILIQFIDNSFVDNVFSNTMQKDNLLPFIGSFMPANDSADNNPGITSHEDDLVMWRTYGKDESGSEAKGCSIILNESFFDEYAGTRFPIRDVSPSELTTSNTVKENSKVAYPTKRCDSLFNVIYYDKRKKHFIINQEKNEPLNNIMTEFKDKISMLVKLFENELTNVKNKYVNDLVYTFISCIRYFMKSADYAYENEIRVIHFEEPSSDRIIIKDNRMHVESDKVARDYIVRMNLGPKVENPEKYKFLEIFVNNSGNKKFKMFYSSCRFR